MTLLWIGLGGFGGAIARYAIDSIVTGRLGAGFPWGTLVVNATGSFVLGLLFVLSQERTDLPAEIRGPVLVGFLGAYTTFSTFMLESWRLVEFGRVARGGGQYGRLAGRRHDRPPGRTRGRAGRLDDAGTHRPARQR